MSTKYLESIQEVRQWLSYKSLDEFIYLLLDNGYDDLEVLSMAGNDEVLVLEGLFAQAEHKRGIRVLVESLRTVGIEPYRSKSDKSGMTEFKKLLAAEAACPPAASAASAGAATGPPAATSPAPSASPAPKIAVSLFSRAAAPSTSGAGAGTSPGAPPGTAPRRPTTTTATPLATAPASSPERRPTVTPTTTTTAAAATADKEKKEKEKKEKEEKEKKAAGIVAEKKESDAKEAKETKEKEAKEKENKEKADKETEEKKKKETDDKKKADEKGDEEKKKKEADDKKKEDEKKKVEEKKVTAAPAKAAASASASASSSSSSSTPSAPGKPAIATASASLAAGAPLSPTTPKASSSSSLASTAPPSPLPSAAKKTSFASSTRGGSVAAHTGYLCVRFGRGDFKQDSKECKEVKWADKWVVLESPVLRWLTSRKENTTDQTFTLTSTSIVRPTDTQTLRLQFADRWVELWSSIPAEASEWQSALEQAREDLKTPHLAVVTSPKATPAGLVTTRGAAGSLSSKSSNGDDTDTEAPSTPPSASPSPSAASLLGSTPSPQTASSALREAADSSDDDDATPRTPRPGQASTPTAAGAAAAAAASSTSTPPTSAKKIAAGEAKAKAGSERKDSKDAKGDAKETKARTDGKDDSGSDEDEDNSEGEDDLDSNATWDQVVKAQASRSARMSLAVGPPVTLRTSSGPTAGAAGAGAGAGAAGAGANAAGSPKAETPSERRFKLFSATLLTGAIFKKFKRGNMSKRLIWVTPNFDFLCWGDEERNNVKGYMLTNTIEEINQGFGRNICKIYIVAASRTLELEAKLPDVAKEWVGAIEFLIQFTKVQEEKKRVIVSKPGYKDKLDEVKAESTRLLLDGDTFKKWPGRKKIVKGAFTVRRIWADPIDALNWGEAASTRVKGTILLQDMVQILEDDTDRLKFTVFSKGRSLDLEAKSASIRERWVKALRFWIEYNKTQPRKKSLKGKAGDD